MYNEPEIIVDGKKLSFGEAMTMRVALSSFISDLAENGLGEDEMGKEISKGYIKNGKSIINPY